MAFNQSQADNIVVGSVAGVLVIGMASDYLVKDETPSFKFFAGVAVTGAVLAYMADISPEAAAWLAIIIFVVVLLEEGAPVLKELNSNKNIGNVHSKQAPTEGFPLIPFKKEKGKKIPRPIKPFAPLPVRKPTPAPAPERVRINLRKFPVPFFTPIPGAGNSKEAEIETPSGERIRIPWKELEVGAAGGLTAGAVAKGVIEFIGAAADEVVRPVG